MGISAVSNLNLYGIYKAPKVPQNKLCGNYGLVNRNLQSDTVSFGANTNNAKKGYIQYKKCRKHLFSTTLSIQLVHVDFGKKA